MYLKQRIEFLEEKRQALPTNLSEDEKSKTMSVFMKDFEETTERAQTQDYKRLESVKAGTRFSVMRSDAALLEFENVGKQEAYDEIAQLSPPGQGPFFKMNSLGLNIIMRMGCLCSKQSVRLNGKVYYVRERLGEGGFSVVELVEDSGTHEMFALKRIPCHSPEDQRVSMMEVECHKSVSHPGVMELIDYDLKQKRDPLEDISSELLILMPYYQRGTLASELSRRETRKAYFAEKEVLRIFRCICEAVEAFHTAEPEPLAHRDLKTANILLDENFNPVLMDLGSMTKARVNVKEHSEAKQLEEVAAERSSMPYRAPELFHVTSNLSIDERSDVWSLGCILFALCFFKSPYDIVYERHDSVALAVVSGRVDIPQDSPFSKEIEDLIKYILVVDHKVRPFVHDVLERLRELEMKNQGCV